MTVEYSGQVLRKDQFSEEKKHKARIAALEAEIERLHGIFEAQVMETEKWKEQAQLLKERVDRDRNKIATLTAKTRGMA